MGGFAKVFLFFLFWIVSSLLREKALGFSSKASSLRFPLVLSFASPAVGGVIRFSPPAFLYFYPYLFLMFSDSRGLARYFSSFNVFLYSGLALGRARSL